MLRTPLLLLSRPRHVMARNFSSEVAKAQAAGPVPDTLFSKILRKEIPSTAVYEDEVCRMSVLRTQTCLLKYGFPRVSVEKDGSRVGRLDLMVPEGECRKGWK